MKEQVSQIQQDVTAQLRDVLQSRSLCCVFQPIFGFREGRIIGYEALVRGPEGSLIESPFELFNAAHRAGLAVELNTQCAEKMLRSFAANGLDGSLFLNISPQLIMQRGLEQARVARFLESLDLDPSRVVIELTEDYPTIDFRLVQIGRAHV